MPKIDDDIKRTVVVEIEWEARAYSRVEVEVPNSVDDTDRAVELWTDRYINENYHDDAPEELLWNAEIQGWEIRSMERRVQNCEGQLSFDI